MRFLNYLTRLRPSQNRGQQSQRPTKLQRRPLLEQLEDRMVPSSAQLFGPNLVIVATPGDSILFQRDFADHSRLDLSTDNGTIGVITPLAHFQAASIKTVTSLSQGAIQSSAIQIDYSNGSPLDPGTTISLTGDGTNHFLQLFDLNGSREITGGEVFTAGTATQNGSISLAGSTFRFTSAFSAVGDEVFNTNPADTLTVNTTGRTVTQSGGGGFQTLDGLASGGGGGNTLIIGNKAEVDLELSSTIALVTLKATGANASLKGFTVDLLGANDRVDIQATPKAVSTAVQAIGQSDTVDLRANAGFVNILDNSTTEVILGSDPFNFATSVTLGINRDVSVIGAGRIFVEDGGNHTTSENVKVSESTVGGTGLFGNNSVVLHYSASFLQLDPGQEANTYTVKASHVGARFSSAININDVHTSATKAQNIVVDLDSKSGLNLDIFDQNPVNAHLLISAPDGKFNPLKPSTPNGKETVTFTGGLTSTITYFGIGHVSHS
jgi:hypothetical protein